MNGVVAAAAADASNLAGSNTERIVSAEAAKGVRRAAGSGEIIPAGCAREIVVPERQREVGHGPIERIERRLQDTLQFDGKELGNLAKRRRVVSVPVEGKGK